MYPLNFHYLYGTVLYLRVNLFVLSIPLLRLFCASKRFEFTLGFFAGSCTSIVVFCVVFCESFFVFSSVILWPLYYMSVNFMDSDYRFGIFKLFFMLNTIRINMITSTELKYILLVLLLLASELSVRL